MLEHFGQSCQAKSSTINPSFVQELVNELDSWEMDKWRVWVLNGVSCASDAIQVANRMYANSRNYADRKLDSLLALAEALFHSGLYKQAGKAYREAALLARNSFDWDKRLKAELGIVESNRVAGYWFRAHRKIIRLSTTLPQQAPSEEREKVESAIALKRALLRRYPFYLAKLLRLRGFSRKIRMRASKELAFVASYSVKQGSWFDFQHCEMLAGKFQIPFSDIYSGTATPLSAHEGYKQLGYFLAEMMAYRNLLADYSISAPPLRVEYLTQSQALGVNPEVWKLSRAIKRRFGKQALPKDIRQAEKKAWLTCESNYRTKV